MKTNNLSLVVMGSVLLAAVLVSFLLARPALLQSQSRPVFIGESLVVNNVLAWPMIKAQAMTKVAAQVASVPLLESKVIPILPILAPSISYSFLPSYPAAALRAGVTGVTILSLQINFLAYKILMEPIAILPLALIDIGMNQKYPML